MSDKDNFIEWCEENVLPVDANPTLKLDADHDLTIAYMAGQGSKNVDIRLIKQELKVAQERIEELEADKNRLDKINDDLADLIEHLTKNYHNERQNMIWVYQKLGLSGQHEIRSALDKIKANQAENKELKSLLDTAWSEGLDDYWVNHDGKKWQERLIELNIIPKEWPSKKTK